MIYLIGGVPRSGKSLLRKTLATKGIDEYQTDILRDSFLKRYTPAEVRIDHSERVEYCWPYLQSFIRILIQRIDHDCCVEGDIIVPTKIDELGDLATNFRAVFLGYAEIDIDKKYQDIKNNPSEYEWTDTMAEAQLKPMISGLVEKSNTIKNQCAALGFKYIDTSTDFMSQIEHAAAYLLNG